MSEFDFDVVSEARPVPRRNPPPPAPAEPKAPAERQKEPANQQ